MSRRFCLHSWAIILRCMAEAETPATSYPDDGTMCRLPFLSACQPPRHSAGVSTSQVNARPDDRVPVWLIRAVCMTDHHAFHRASCVGMLSPPRTFSHHRPRPIAPDLKAFRVRTATKQNQRSSRIVSAVAGTGSLSSRCPETAWVR
jgi:hypothetical protein